MVAVVGQSVMFEGVRGMLVEEGRTQRGRCWRQVVVLEDVRKMLVERRKSSKG